MKMLILLLVVALVACAAPPKVIEKPLYVDRFVMINCVDNMPIRPFLVVPTLTEADSLDTVSDAYMIDRLSLLGYVDLLESVLIACGARPVEGIGSVPGKATENTGGGER